MYLLRRTGDYSLAEDLLQETFTRCLKHYRQADVGLLYTIARNAQIDYYRRSAKRQTRALEEVAQSPAQEQSLSDCEEVDRVLAAMLRLPDAERELLSFVAADDLSYAEIADIVGISLANLKVRVHRARQNLRELLREE